MTLNTLANCAKSVIEKLESINLSNNVNLQESSVGYLLSKLNHRQLKSISLSRCKIKAKTLDHSLSGPLANLQTMYFPYMSHLDDISSLLSRCPNLTKLDVRESPISDSSIISLADHCKNLRCVNLSRCSGITAAAFVHLFSSLFHLNHVNVSSCNNFNPKAFLALISNCKSLKNIELADLVTLTDPDLIRIKELQCLEKVSVAGCRIKSSSLISIAKNCFALKKMDISRTQLTDYRGVIEFLQHAKNLQIFIANETRSVNSDTENFLKANTQHANILFRTGVVANVVTELGKQFSRGVFPLVS